jgi:hypothetical protein
VGEPDDQVLWDAVVAAQAELAARHVDFYRNAHSPVIIIARALRGQPREHAAALRFLARFGFLRDHLELLPGLIGMAQSHRWALWARWAIGGAGQDRVIPALKEQIPPLLQTADSGGLRRNGTASVIAAQQMSALPTPHMTHSPGVLRRLLPGIPRRRAFRTRQRTDAGGARAAHQ